MENLKNKIDIVGFAGAIIYGTSTLISKSGINIGLAIMTLCALFYIKDFKISNIKKQEKFLLLLLILIPIFDFFSPGGVTSSLISIEKSYRFLPFFMAPIFINNEDRIKYFLYSIGVSVLINCIYGLNIYKSRGWNFSARYESFTPIMDSAHTLVGISFLILGFLVYLLKKKDIKSFCFILMVYIVQLVCILFSQTRGAWLALLGGLFIFLFFSIDKKKFAGIVLTLCLILIGVSQTESFKTNRYVQRFKSIKNIESDSPKIRLLMWEASFNIFLEHPIFGVGKDNAPKYYLEYFEKNNKYDEVHNKGMLKYIAEAGNSHNMYFENLTNMGSLFLVLLTFWGYIAYSQLRTLISLSKEDKKYWLLLGSMCLVISYYITGLTEGAWGEFWKRNFYLVGIIVYFSIRNITVNKNMK